jgi:hypothetical protein
VTVSTELTRARRSQAALALDPIPASKAQSDPPEIAEFDKHNFSSSSTPAGSPAVRTTHGGFSTNPTRIEC